MKKKTNVVRSNDTFHNLEIISDIDCIKVKNHFVLEVNPSNNLVCQFYDKRGICKSNFLEFNLLMLCSVSPRSEENIIAYILEIIGTRNVYISTGAVVFIKSISK